MDSPFCLNSTVFSLFTISFKRSDLHIVDVLLKVAPSNPEPLPPPPFQEAGKTTVAT